MVFRKEIMDVLTKEQRRKNMQRIRSTDTKPEVMLRKALWHHGIRYRKNYKGLPGTPDIAITKYRIAVFVDGGFWHANKNCDGCVKDIMQYLPRSYSERHLTE